MESYYPYIGEDHFSDRLLSHSEFYELAQSVLDTSTQDVKEKMSILKARLMNQNIALKPYQEYVSRFISSFTPYESLLIFHSPGSGKTLSLLNILKNNIEYFVNQNSFVYIFVPRRLLKMQWMQSIKQYFPELENYIIISTYKSLYNKVIGERKVVIDEETLRHKKKHVLSSLNVSYSEYENSILVLEEAHNVTNNNFTLAINRLRENVRRKKTICLTATPIKNTIDEIIDLFNFLHTDRVLNKQDYFTYVDGRAVLQNKEKLVKDMTGYVSTLNINNSPYLARRVQVGKLVDGLTDIYIVKISCPDNYRKIIDRILSKRNDSLGRIFESLSNVIFPYFINGKLTFLYGNRGYELVVDELQTNSVKFNKALCSILNVPETVSLLSLTSIKQELNKSSLKNSQIREEGSFQEKSRQLTGQIFSRKYVNMISPKMRYLFDLIERLSGNIFIYSSYKRVFIDLFAEMLLNEGYQDYRYPSRGFEALKKCYACKQTQHAHSSLSHVWQPLSFFLVDSSDLNLMDTLNVYNSSTNIDGRYIKIILASVMVNEGISLKNTIHVINVDGQPTMSRKEQIERRAIRLDSHDDFILRNNVIPNVYIYNLALYHAKSNVPSIEVSLYKLAESKNVHVKELYSLIERASIDFGVYSLSQKSESLSTIALEREKKYPIVNTTRSLIKKDSRIDQIIKYITSIFKNISVILYTDLLLELQSKFDEASVLIAIRHMAEIESLFIVSMNNSVYIFSNLITVSESIDERFLDIHLYYKIEKTKVSDDLFYDMDYINSKLPNEICGIVSSKFKLKISNDIINSLKLSFVTTKKENKQVMKGWICSQSIGKSNLGKLMKYFKIDTEDISSKSTCDRIYKVLYDMEKYSTDNKQFLIYPKNHPNIPPILNIYDRLNFIVIQYESKGYKVKTSQTIIKDKFVSLGKSRYPVLEFTCICTKNESEKYIDENSVESQSSQSTNEVDISPIQTNINDKNIITININ